ncbi:hypothetical protein FB440_12820 [Vibrio crassostreae]|uniref:hypothetical protein n=1 Tax=Vibrio crassostreae TaxID=246167 RepID=UPI000F46D47E|nr:hypothetical protein [Vibrio crassostreae]ROR24221.1 hypothetical protein EDB67_105231 [Vibrio crassostreae]TCN76173.1 hypothetical protein EDB62_11064 [Vibrio crassostreae]TCV24942.1 hypothetical protein EDB71_11028 [Vibrio crassostreae]TWD31592.1 hypothetical protein FB440_12820 [Vibrio crassostreae]TWD72300.1 hypothetical protein FB445_103242 [Vibrio crassostreae]
MKQLILWSLLFAAMPNYGATLNIKIEGQQIRFENAITLGGNNYTLSDWSIASGLTTTHQFLPSAFVTDKPDTMTLTSNTGQSVEAAIAVNGLQYNTASNPLTRGDNLFVTPVCSQSQLSGNIVTLHDSDTQNCSADFSLDYPQSITPFYFYRPTFNIDTASLLNALQGQAKGVYTATIPADIKYYYRSAGGALTYRILPDVFTVNIDYTPNSLESIDVVGDGVLSPVYDTTNHTVSAQTTFNITAIGQFSTGLSMTLLTNEFELTSASGKTSIPYSIQCNEANCEDTDWVKSGVNQLDNNQTSYVIQSPSSVINFDLSVNYQNIPSTDVETGTYSGNFTVMFEELY